MPKAELAQSYGISRESCMSTCARRRQHERFLVRVEGLPNDIVRSNDGSGGKRYPKRFCRPGIEKELELSGLLDRKVAWFRALQNVLHIRCLPTGIRDGISSIA